MTIHIHQSYIPRLEITDNETNIIVFPERKNHKEKVKKKMKKEEKNIVETYLHLKSEEIVCWQLYLGSLPVPMHAAKVNYITDNVCIFRYQYS